MTFGQHTILEAQGQQTGGSIKTPKPKPLKIGLYNIMPNKRTTGDDITAIFSQFHPNVEFVYISATGQDHKSDEEKYALAGDAYEKEAGYISWKKAKHLQLDRMIITGADLARKTLKQVDFCDELTEIFNITAEQNTPKLMTCWASDAHGEHNYGVEKIWQQRKSIDVKPHDIEAPEHYSVKGLKSLFAPIARNTEVLASAIDSARGAFNIATMTAPDGQRVAGLIGHKGSHDLSTRFHLEYGSDQNLWKEYQRDTLRHARNPRMYPTSPLPVTNIDPNNFGMRWGLEREAILGRWTAGEAADFSQHAAPQNAERFDIEAPA